MVRHLKVLYTITLLLVIPVSVLGVKLKTVHLEDYGSIDKASIDNTIRKAMQDLDGKRLQLPNIPIECNEIKITGRNKFVIEGSRQNAITCSMFQIDNSNQFEITGIYLKGTVNKFSSFNVIGDCSDFSIHNCLFDSEKQVDGHNSFYGIHIIADIQQSDVNFSNSPRNFRVYDNLVKNTKYDGILVHAYCSNFVIERNKIEDAECIGIEVEGRLGGAQNTTVHPCRNATIRNNEMRNCGGWGILLMWVDNAIVKNNVSKNAFGPFLSIGSKNIKIKNNIFEGSGKGFEISQEFYKVSNGINEHVVVTGNTIKGFPRAWDRGVLDIRHARDVIVKKNKFVSVDREQSCYISVCSSRDIIIRSNEFLPTTQPLETAIIINDVNDPETDEYIQELNTRDIRITNNKFIKIPFHIEKGFGDFEDRNIVIKQ